MARHDRIVVICTSGGGALSVVLGETARRHRFDAAVVRARHVCGALTATALLLTAGQIRCLGSLETPLASKCRRFTGDLIEVRASVTR